MAHSRTDCSAGPRPEWVLAGRSGRQAALLWLINHQSLILDSNTRRHPRLGQLCHNPMPSPVLSHLPARPVWAGGGRPGLRPVFPPQAAGPRPPHHRCLWLKGPRPAQHRPGSGGVRPGGAQVPGSGSHCGGHSPGGFSWPVPTGGRGARPSGGTDCGAEDRSAPGWRCGPGRGPRCRHARTRVIWRCLRGRHPQQRCLTRGGNRLPLPPAPQRTAAGRTPLEGRLGAVRRWKYSAREPRGRGTLLPWAPSPAILHPPSGFSCGNHC